MTAHSYRTRDGGRLVEVGPARAIGLPRDGAAVALDDGTCIEARVFQRFDADGAAIAQYGHPSSSALDDYLYVVDVHFVRDGTLYSGMLEMGAGTGTYRTRLSTTRMRLEGLEPE